jgi:hypothetical protein
MSLHRTLSICALAALLPLGARAQQYAAETIDQQAPPATQGAPTGETANPSNSDLGQVEVVRKFPKPDMFTASVTQQGFYTDNVFYSDAAPVGSFAYLGSYNVSYVPYATRDWTPRISAQYNMVRYDRAASGDFDNENLVLSSTYVFSNDRTWSWTAAVDLSRFTAPHAADHEFYQEVDYDNQVAHSWQIFRDSPELKETPLFFVSTYELDYHQASPSMYDRLDNAVYLGLAWYPLPQLSLTPFVRPEARNYFTNVTGVQTGRNDFNLSEGLTVSYQPIKYLNVSANIIHTDDYSNNKGLNYSSTIPGIALTGTYSF